MDRTRTYPIPTEQEEEEEYLCHLQDLCRVDRAGDALSRIHSPEAERLREGSSQGVKWDLVHAEILLRLDHVDQAYELCRRHLDPPATIASATDLAALRNLEGLCLLELGQGEAAVRSFEMARALFHQARNRLGEADALLALGRLDFHVGNLQSARDQLREAHRLYEEIERTEDTIIASLELTHIHLGLGEVDEARQTLAGAWGSWRRTGDEHLAVELRRTAARLHVRLGAPRKARRFFGLICDRTSSDDGAEETCVAGSTGEGSLLCVEDVITETEIDLAESRAEEALNKLSEFLSRNGGPPVAEAQRLNGEMASNITLVYLQAEGLFRLGRPSDAMSALLGALPALPEDGKDESLPLAPATESDTKAFRRVARFLDEVRDPYLGGRLGLLLCQIVMVDPSAQQIPVTEIREVLLDSRSLLRRVHRRDLVRRVDHLLEELWLRCPWTVETGQGAESDGKGQKPRPSSHYVRHRKSGYGDFVTRDGRLLAILESIDLMSTTDLPVLIVGESGTGKELIARAIHEVSPRCDSPFVPINCGAIPGELHESEFFGHLRGSFTGALADKTGLFEQAHGGTVFLDEIGEMERQAQVKLLRILESGEIRRVGETRLRRVDVRIVAATNSDLEKQLEEGRFRRDLFYRILGYEIHLPPLRERPGDILVIAEHFLREGNRGCSKQLRFTAEARGAMLEREWHGNVRELRYVVQKGVAHARLIDSRDVTTEMLGLDREDGRRDPFWRSPLRIHLPLEAPLDRYLEEVERRIVVQALEENSWNRTRAAQSLGQISRTTLIGKMKRLGLFTDSRKSLGEDSVAANESSASR